jgi:folate-dependent phosphoribosylglycinamide formyltransferase PurN
MEIDPIYDLYDRNKRPMSVVGFFSGGASSLMAILEEQEKVFEGGQQPYKVVGAFTDNPEASGIKKLSKFDIPILIRDIDSFYARRGIKDYRQKINDPEERKKLDRKLVRKIRTEYDNKNMVLISNLGDTGRGFNLNFGMLSGYMWYLTTDIINAFDVIMNVHPADLTIKNEKGKPKFIGDNAVYDAVRAGQTYTKSSIHIVTLGVDEGPLVVQSKPLPVEGLTEDIKNDDKLLREFSSKHQGRMKDECDIPAFKKAVELTALGKVAFVEGEVYLLENKEWQHAPTGYQLSWKTLV